MDNEGRCVSCERYIGDALNCPYCDCEARHARALRALRVGALVLAVLGVATLHAWMRCAPVPLRDDGQAAALLAPPRAIPLVRAILAPHLHWMLWCAIAFMLLSEWPRAMLYPGVGRRRRLLLGWTSPLAGLATFGLTGWLGVLLFHPPPLALDRSMVALLPASMGLLAVPPLILGTHGANPPRQGRVAGLKRLAGPWAKGLVVCALVWGTAGWGGMAVLAVATCIGGLPVLFGSPRMNCLGLVLLPAALNLSGL